MSIRMSLHQNRNYAKFSNPQKSLHPNVSDRLEFVMKLMSTKIT